jgi:hypothetical protein
VFLYGGDSISGHVMSRPLNRFAHNKVDIYRYVTDHEEVPCPESMERRRFGNHWMHAWCWDNSSTRRVDFVLCPDTKNQRNLLKLLHHSRNCTASDKRDHVYAFLSLANGSYSINIDYSMANTIGPFFRHVLNE